MAGEPYRTNRDPYSTLEVSYPDAGDKLVIPTAPEKIPTAPHDGDQTFEPHGSSNTTPIEPTKDLPGRHKRPRCGMSPATFWILVAVLTLLILGAIGGGIAGGVLSRKSTSPTPSFNDGAPTLSQLSAVNWTDSSNKKHETVFYQRNGKLWLSQSEDGSANWTDHSIESLLLPGETVPLNPKWGTPLASVVARTTKDPVIYLYYLDAGLKIRDIRTSDAASNIWVPGELWNATHTAVSTTALAALAHYCPEGCLNQNIVVFQSNDEGPGGLCWTSGRDWSNKSYLVSADSGAGLSMFQTSLMDERSGKPDNTKMTQARLLYHRDGLIENWLFNEKGDFGWRFSDYGGVISNVPQPQRLAAAQTVNNALGLVLALDRNSGNIKASYLPSTGQWNVSANAKENRSLQTSFQNEAGSTTENKPEGPPLAAIALTSEGSMYTLSGDSSHINQYSWSNSGPERFSFSGPVL